MPLAGHPSRDTTLVNVQQKKAELEKRAKALLGETIVGVRYLEIDYGAPGWDYEHLHSVDFGVDWKMKSGETFCFIWDTDFVQHNLALKEQPCEHHFTSAKAWDASNDDGWLPLLHRRISEVEIYYWSWFEDGQTGARTYYPKDTEVAFEHGRSIFLSSADYCPETDESWSAGADDVAVVFSAGSAQRYRLGPHAAPGQRRS